jgi:hypothetical protein
MRKLQQQCTDKAKEIYRKGYLKNVEKKKADKRRLDPNDLDGVTVKILTQGKVLVNLKRIRDLDPKAGPSGERKKRQRTTATAKPQSIKRPTLTWVSIETPATAEMSMSPNSQLNRVAPIEPGAKGLNTDAEISIEFAGSQLPTV